MPYTRRAMRLRASSRTDRVRYRRTKQPQMSYTDSVLANEEGYKPGYILRFVPPAIAKSLSRPQKH